ncbi:MAG: hypothetical protein ACI9CB_001813 [Rhodothermales bacterium]
MAAYSGECEQLNKDAEEIPGSCIDKTLAEEMPVRLGQIRDETIEAVANGNRMERRSLTAKGIRLGTISAFPNGSGVLILDHQYFLAS